MPGSNLFTGTLDLLILQSLQDGARHGYAIGRWIRDTTEDVLQIEEGVLYPALHRLEGRDLLSASWGHTETNRRAKFYQLTPTGTERLAAETARWDQHAKAVQAILSTRSA